MSLKLFVLLDVFVFVGWFAELVPGGEDYAVLVVVFRVLCCWG